MKLEIIHRKGPVLKKAKFGCLNRVLSINITKGCSFRCVYCYARAYPGNEDDGVYLYENLIERLDRETKRTRLVKFVVFNTATDCFQPHPAILDTTYFAMKLLLERRYTISFLTKGFIPDRFIELFSDYPESTICRIGLVSLSERFHHIFEPLTATPSQRLSNIERLKGAGLDVEVRIDPIVPFYTDTASEIDSLLSELNRLGVRTVTLSYLHLRPGIIKQLRRELPQRDFKMIISNFPKSGWQRVGTSTMSRLVPLPLRKRGYARFREIAQRYQMEVKICACKNPDMKAQRCISFREDLEPVRQLRLFN